VYVACDVCIVVCICDVCICGVCVCRVCVMCVYGVRVMRVWCVCDVCICGVCVYIYDTDKDLPQSFQGVRSIDSTMHTPVIRSHTQVRTHQLCF